MSIILANGNLLIDSHGKRWLDMQSGILNTPFGHGSSVISDALGQVLRDGLVNTYDRPSRAQGELIELMDIYKPGYTWKPFNTGAEAIEKAIQVAASYFGRLPRIAVLPNSFHGKMLSMAWANYGDKVPWGNPLDLIIVDPNEPANPDFDVLIYEPVQGWDGTVNNEARLRELCNERAALRIADEMITGFMRCGKRFMSQHADIIVCGKGISAGVPLSMLGFRQVLLDDSKGTIATGWRTTGAGNNLASTVGLYSLKALLEAEEEILLMVSGIQTFLEKLGFSATGALGFKALKHYAETKAFFEEDGLIASFHCPPKVRVGPAFTTDQAAFIRLATILEQAGEL